MTPLQGCGAADKRSESKADQSSRANDTQALSDGSVNGDFERCLIDGVRVPELKGSHFLAVENLFWTARALGLRAEATLKDLRDAGMFAYIKHMCG